VHALDVIPGDIGVLLQCTGPRGGRGRVWSGCGDDRSGERGVADLLADRLGCPGTVAGAGYALTGVALVQTGRRGAGDLDVGAVGEDAVLQHSVPPPAESAPRAAADILRELDFVSVHEADGLCLVNVHPRHTVRVL
jgi:hypothetical protein